TIVGSAGDSMTSGQLRLSANSGATWTPWNPDSCFLFQEKGQSVGEFLIGGCELDNYVVANPNASFDIRRYFTNLCGSTLTVQEIGIASLVRRLAASSLTVAHPILIARDVVAAVNVLNTEVLRVTYTPSVTV
ncbi:MAG: hypothetical protein Q8R28_07645, partial [Dehalococcoidia bacterium]|nr:hypothetical protein [Dehalococcoidia bacterium]